METFYSIGLFKSHMSSAPWKVIPWKLIVILLQAYSYLNFNYNTAQNEFYMFQSSIT